MTYLWRYGSRLFITVLEILLFTFLGTLLYYYDFIGDKTYAFIKMILVLGCILYNSYLLGREVTQKGYLEGIKYGGIIILLLFLLSFIEKSFQGRVFIYYFLILASSTLGSMIGISRKKKR